MKPSKIVGIIITLLFVTQGIAQAQGIPPGSLTYKDVIDLYGLKPVDSVSPGIVPLQFASPEELARFLGEVSNRSHVHPHISYEDRVEKSNLAIGQQSAYNPTSVSYGVVTRSCSVTPCFATFNTWADIRVGYSGSFRWIDSVLNTRTGLTGVTLAVDLTNEYSYAYDQSPISVSVKGGGILNVYLLIEGMVRVYSTPVSCSFTYSVY